MPIEKLPKGYYIPAPGTPTPGRTGLSGKPMTYTEPGQAYPDGRPGRAITWDDEHGTWRPPGFSSDPSDHDRVFNQATGQNGVWDGDKQAWIDTATGQPISYEQ